MQWFRRTFIAGFFVTVPLFITVAALVWIFRVIDGLTAPLSERLFGREISAHPVVLLVDEPTTKPTFCPP